MGIAPSDEGTSDEPDQPRTATARELAARNVSDLWLRWYLTPKQLDTVARLSLFAATFDAAGAATLCLGLNPSLADQRDAAIMLRCLRGLSVLQEARHAAAAAQQPRYGMHLLVRGLAADVLRRQPEDSQTAAVTGFVAYVLDVGDKLASLRESSGNAAAEADRLLALEAPNLQAMLQLMAEPEPYRAMALLEGNSEQAVEWRVLIVRMSYALSWWGQPGLALDAARTAYSARQTWPDDESTLMSANNLSLTLGNAGQFREAADVARQALAAWKRVYGPEHPGTLRCLDHLSVSLAHLGQHLEAADTARKVLTARQRVLDPEHPDVLTSLSDRSERLAQDGQHQQAADMARQVLAAQQRKLGPEHPDTLSTLSNLSLWLAELGHDQEAAHMARQALAVRQHVLGPKHPHTLASLNNISLMLMKLGQRQEAVDMARQVLAARQRVLGPKHPHTLASMDNIIIMLMKLGQDQEAVDMARQVLAARQRVLGL